MGARLLSEAEVALVHIQKEILMKFVVMVTPFVGARERPVAGDLAACLGESDDYTLAVLDLVQRLACEAARGWWAAQSITPSSQYAQHRSPDHDRGWRAYLSQETAHLIGVMEESGRVEFVFDDGRDSAETSPV